MKCLPINMNISNISEEVMPSWALSCFSCPVGWLIFICFYSIKLNAMLSCCSIVKQQVKCVKEQVSMNEMVTTQLFKGCFWQWQFYLLTKHFNQICPPSQYFDKNTIFWPNPAKVFLLQISFRFNCNTSCI